MLATLLATGLLFARQDPPGDIVRYLRGLDGKSYAGMVRTFVQKVPVTKRSPKRFGDPPKPWEFEWLTAAYGAPDRPPIGGANDPLRLTWRLRFAVYSQLRKATGDPAEGVAQMLIRLWKYNFDQLELDHSSEFNGRIVDVYLAWGGKAGGEQLFDVDAQNPSGRPTKVNTIYFYDLASFTDPVEMAREVAHEYGHAALPPIGGFGGPEDWAGGYLGERLYLRWLRDQIRAGRLSSDDSMGATAGRLDAWVAANVDPLADGVALRGPDLVAIGRAGKAGIDAYLGLALYASELLPARVFARALDLVGSTSAKDFPPAIRLAASEPAQLNVSVPSRLAGKAIWIPIGNGQVFGAKLLRKRDGWAKVQPGAGAIVVVPKRAGSP